MAAPAADFREKREGAARAVLRTAFSVFGVLFADGGKTHTSLGEL